MNKEVRGAFSSLILGVLIVPVYFSTIGQFIYLGEISILGPFNERLLSFQTRGSPVKKLPVHFEFNVRKQVLRIKTC